MKKWIKKAVISFGLMGAMTPLSAQSNEKNQSIFPVEGKYFNEQFMLNLWNRFGVVDATYRTIDYQIDTLAENKIDVPAAYYVKADNTITANFLPNNKDQSDYNKSESILVHEQKHRDNQKKGLYAYPVSAEQMYKLSMHDEISASIASILSLRQQYIEAKNLNVFSQLGSRQVFYIKAIIRKEIDPLSSDPDDFEREMAFIFRETQKKWLEEDNVLHYAAQNANKAAYYGELDGKHEKFYDENYQRGLKICYVMGGVDFTKYMDKDVQIPEEGLKQLHLNIKNKIEKSKYKGLSHVQVAEFYGIPAYNEDMSFQQYQNLIQQTLALKNMFDCPEDKSFLLNEESYKERYKTEMLTTLLTAQSIVNHLALEYEERGLKPVHKNEKNYEQMQDKLYHTYLNDSNNSKYISLMNRDSSKYVCPVSDNVKKVEKRSRLNMMNARFFYVRKQKSEEIKNEPIHSINTAAPVYRKWEDKDGYRVSKVQYREVLNMDSPFLTAPFQDNSNGGATFLLFRRDRQY